MSVNGQLNKVEKSARHWLLMKRTWNFNWKVIYLNGFSDSFSFFFFSIFLRCLLEAFLIFYILAYFRAHFIEVLKNKQKFYEPRMKDKSQIWGLPKSQLIIWNNWNREFPVCYLLSAWIFFLLFPRHLLFEDNLLTLFAFLER